MTRDFKGRRAASTSGTHVALRILHSLDGQASLSKWHAAVMRDRAIKSEQWDVIVQSLISAGMIFQRREMFIVSDDGLASLGVAVDVVPRAEPLQVPARYVPPERPLSAKNMPHMRSTRDGALDYRDIPSRIGDQLIPHGAKAAA